MKQKLFTTVSQEKNLIYSDFQIEQLINQGLTDSKWKSFINPTSLDLSIGRKAMRLEPPNPQNPGDGNYIFDNVGNQFSKVSLNQLSVIRPGDRYLLETEQYFNLPDNVCGQIRLKSSRGREFYEHLEAGWVNAGHEGRLTLEIINHAYRDLPLFPGLRMAQIIFIECTPPQKTYAGKYYKDLDLSVSKSF